ncbi:MAG: AraC family transcriptional regulator, partial [Streptomycetaceae bacterium]|nr:AraC family transcriptional regulator [Streptomycetaceae bacterium]
MRRFASGGTRWSTVPALGVIRTTGVDISVEHLPPGPDFADVVERFWAAHWAVRPDHDGPGRVVSLPVPEPLVVLRGRRLITHGVLRTRRALEVHGSGVLYGASFRPGVAAALIGGSAAEHTDRVFALADTAWGLRAHRLSADLQTAAPSGLRAVAATFEHHLRGAAPRPGDPDLVRVGEMVDAIRDGGLTRVAELTERFHLSARTIQRVFNRHLGVGPKWLLRHYRLHRAAYRLQYNPPEKWSELAVELGYFDDSHFARDFADTLGVTPAAFVQSAARRPDARR